MQREYAIANATRSSARGLPMTPAVLLRLEAEAVRLADSLPRLQALAQEDGVTGDPQSPTVLAAGDLHVASRRLQMLRQVIANGHVVTPDGWAVVGSRVTVCHSDGEEEHYEIVAPGEADARQGRISPDSPLGAALLGRCPGENIEVDAPAGAQRLAIVAVT